MQAYAARRFDGNFFDLVLPFNYPAEAYADEASREAYSLRRAVKYFFKPSQVNVTKVPKLAKLGRRMGLLYPRQGRSALRLDNRKLDGFIDRFLDKSCIDLDCEKCRYCHAFAEKAVEIDPDYRREVLALYRDLFDDLHDGSFFTMRPRDFVEAARLTRKVVRGAASYIFPSLAVDPEPDVPLPRCPAADEN